MVRFVTTAYTHMYENSYVGRPGERYKKKAPDELTDVGHRVERWRKQAGLEVKSLVRLTNDMLSEGQHIDAKDYWAFVRGQRRITDNQIRMIAKVLGTTVHIMTHYSPGQVPEDEIKSKHKSVIQVHASAERALRKKKAQGTPKPKPKPAPKPYDPDEAATLLATKFGNRVKRTK